MVAPCRYCGTKVQRKDRSTWQYDHVEPTKYIGAANIVIACTDCNKQKQQRTPAEAGMVLHRLGGCPGRRTGQRLRRALSGTRSRTRRVAAELSWSKPGGTRIPSRGRPRVRSNPPSLGIPAAPPPARTLISRTLTRSTGGRQQAREARIPSRLTPRVRSNPPPACAAQTLSDLRRHLRQPQRQPRRQQSCRSGSRSAGKSCRDGSKAGVYARTRVSGQGGAGQGTR